MLQSALPHLRHFIVHLENTMWCTSMPKGRRSLHGCRRCLGKELLFGYQFDPNKKGSYIIDPPAAKIVRRIFDLAILGLGTREIAMTLNDENAPVPSVYNREHKAYGKETTYTIAPVILWDSTRVYTQKKMTFFFDPDGLPLELHE